MQIFSSIILQCILILTLSVAITEVSLAQKKGSSADDCRLDEAKRWYENGDLEKVEVIEACASDPKSMSREKRIEALQLLTESYLYRNKIGRANKSFMKLLEVNPLHEVDSLNEANSWDLIYLSRTYSRRPIFSMYFSAGTNFSLVEQLENYGVDNTTDVSPSETYLKDIVLGGNGAIGFELPLIYGFDLALEAKFGYRTYSFGDSLYLSVNQNNPTAGSNSSLQEPAPSVDPKTGKLLYSTLSFTENQLWIDLPLILKYNVTFKNVLPYIYVGGGPNFLLYADLTNMERTNEIENTGGGEKVEFAKPIVLTKHKEELNGITQERPNMRTRINWSLMAGAGVKFRVGRNFLFFDIRYTRMFLNNVEGENRYSNSDLLYRYGHVDNDYRMDNFAVTFGFTKSFYTPRKKREFNPVTIDNQFNKWLEKERKNIKRETDEELKRELNGTIRELEREKPSLIEDVERGRVGAEIIKDKKKELEIIKNQ
jgi:hypothetical protein